jgi:hypothetical protein
VVLAGHQCLRRRPRHAGTAQRDADRSRRDRLRRVRLAGPGTDTGTGSAAAETVIDEWVSKINSGDEAGVMSLVCEAEKPITQRDTDELIGGNAKLEIAEVSDGTYYVSADYTGTLNGEPITG